MKSQGTADNFFRESYIFWIFKSHLKHERSKKALLIFHLHIMLVKNGEYGVFLNITTQLTTEAWTHVRAAQMGWVEETYAKRTPKYFAISYPKKKIRDFIF